MIFRLLLLNLFWTVVTINGSNFCYKKFCRCNKVGRYKNAFCKGRMLTLIPKLPHTVTNVTFSRTNLSQIDAFSNLTFYTNVVKLNLTDNHIQNLDYRVFAGLGNLTDLVVSREPKLNISSLNGVISVLSKHSLVNLEMSFNGWTKLPPDMFSNLVDSNIQKIVLTGNNLNNVSGKIFTTLKKLTSLTLSKNKITRFSLQGMSNLNILNVDDNSLTSIPRFCDNFGKSLVPYLDRLRLSKNPFTFFGQRSFDCLPNIRVLHLNGFNVGKIQNNMFVNMPVLTTLNMRKFGNPLKKIEKFAFNISSLQKLVLSENNFHFDGHNFDSKTIFALCSNLTSLDISGNILSTGNLKNMLQTLSNIHTLTLSSGKLSEFPVHIFTKLKNLKSLNLDNNRISSWNNGHDIFGNSTNLEILNLLGNRISVINESSFPVNMLNSLKKLYLARNTFSCVCEQLWFLNWIRTTNVTLVDYPKMYTCSSPSNMNGILLKDYHPTIDSCKPWNPLYTMIIAMTSILTLAILVVAIAIRCQNNIKNFMYYIRVFQKRRQGYLLLGNVKDHEYHAFVVYCDSDRIWVHGKLLDKLEKEEGLKLCIHHRDFTAGESITENIDNFLQKSWKVLVVISNNFSKSEWCQWEVDVIHERRRKLGKYVVLPVLLENIDSKHMTGKLRTLLESTPYLRYNEGVGSDLFWKALIEGLRKPIKQPPVSVL